MSDTFTANLRHAIDLIEMASNEHPHTELEDCLAVLKDVLVDYIHSNSQFGVGA